MSQTILTAGLLLCVTAKAHAQSRPAADLIITNSRAWTVNAAQPEAEAIAVWRDRIVAIGSSEDVDAWRDSETKVIDGRGRRVLPGFNNAHVHFLSGGQQLESVELRDANSPEEFARRIAEHAANRPSSEWVVGGNWDDQRWSPKKLPTKELIDPVTATTPVFVVRYDGSPAGRGLSDLVFRRSLTFG